MGKLCFMCFPCVCFVLPQIMETELNVFKAVCIHARPLGRADRGRRRFPQRELGTLFRSTYVAELPGRTQYGYDWVSPSRGHAELGPSDCCFNTSSRWPPAERDVSLLFNVTAVHWLDEMCQSWGVGTTEPLRINISKKKKRLVFSTCHEMTSLSVS